MNSISEVVTGDKSLDKLYVEANNLKNKISNENSVIYFPYVKSSEDYDSLYLYYNYLKHRLPLGVDKRNHLKSRTKLKKELQVDLLKTLLSVCNFVLPRKISKAKIKGNAGDPEHSILTNNGWYWIEILKYDENSGNSGLIVDETPGAKNLDRLGLRLNPSVVYRITAIAQGLKPNTKAVIQETYARTRLQD